MNLMFRSFLTILITFILSNIAFSSNVVSWKFKTSGTVYSTPLIVDETVYIGSADSFFYAINIDDGSEVWSYKSGDGIFSTAAFSNNIICFESRNILYGLNSDGTEKWKVTISEGSVTNHYDEWDCFHSSPVIVDSIAYAGSERGAVIGVNIFTGAEALRINTGNTGIGVRVTPAVYDGKIYFGECSGKFYCYNISTGEKIWEYDTNPEKLWQDPAILTNPVIKDGIVYFGGRHCHLYGLDALTGNKVWRYSDPNNMWILGGPAISDSLLFMGSSNQQLLHLLNINSQKLLWRKKFNGRIFGTPLVDGDIVFFGTGMEINDKIGSVYAVNKFSGELVNCFNVGAQVHSSPVVGGNKLIFGSRDGYVYALDKNEMLTCEHPETGFSEEGAINLGELSRDTTIIIKIKNLTNVSDSVSLSLSAQRNVLDYLELSPKEIFIAPQSNNDISLTIKASQLSAKNYSIVLKMLRHFYIDPVSTTISKSISFKVLQITSVKEGEKPLSFFLSQNYPNPFNPLTRINYSIENASFVELKVYNLIGQEVLALVNEYKDAGNYEVILDAGSITSGVYYYRLKAGNYVSIKKLTVMK